MIERWKPQNLPVLTRDPAFPQPLSPLIFQHDPDAIMQFMKQEATETPIDIKTVQVQKIVQDTSSNLREVRMGKLPRWLYPLLICTILVPPATAALQGCTSPSTPSAPPSGAPPRQPESSTPLPPAFPEIDSPLLDRQTDEVLQRLGITRDMNPDQIAARLKELASSTDTSNRGVELVLYTGADHLKRRQGLSNKDGELLVDMPDLKDPEKIALVNTANERTKLASRETTPLKPLDEILTPEGNKLLLLVPSDKETEMQTLIAQYNDQLCAFTDAFFRHSPVKENRLTLYTGGVGDVKIGNKQFHLNGSEFPNIGFTGDLAKPPNGKFTYLRLPLMHGTTVTNGLPLDKMADWIILNEITHVQSAGMSGVEDTSSLMSLTAIGKVPPNLVTFAYGSDDTRTAVLEFFHQALEISLAS